MSTSNNMSDDGPTLVQIRDLHFSRGSKRIFRGLNMDIPRGRVTTILGPSGTGKTTLSANPERTRGLAVSWLRPQIPHFGFFEADESVQLALIEEVHRQTRDEVQTHWAQMRPA